MSATQYPLSMRLMHWTMSLIIIGMLILGYLMTGWWSEKPFTGSLFFWHKSVGVLVLLLVLWRITLRTQHRNDIPPMAATMIPYERWLANTVHTLLYAMIIIMPISGFLTSVLYPKTSGIPFFFGSFADPFPRSEAWSAFFGSIHINASYCLLAFLFLHVAGVIKHRWFDKPEHDSLRKML